MIQPIEALEILALLMAVLAVTIMGIVVLQFLRRALRGVPHMVRSSIPTLKVKKKEPKPKERKNMANDKDVATEGITFNDIFMFMIAVPLVLLWVGFAGFVIHSGLGKPEVLENIEAYTTLIAILGGPALLIIKDALDVWKQEQAEKTAFYKLKAQSVIDYNEAAQKQAQMIEAKAQDHEHKKK